MFAVENVSGQQWVSKSLSFALILKILMLEGQHMCLVCSHEVLVHPSLTHGTEARSFWGQASKEQKWRTGIRREREGCHGSCPVSVWIFPKRSVFILSHCVKRKDLLFFWGSLLKWTSVELFCLSLAASLHGCDLSAISSLRASPLNGRDCVHPFFISFTILLILPLVNQFSPLFFFLTWQRTEKTLWSVLM